MFNIQKIANKLALTDIKGNLSITNVAMYVIIGKVAVSPLDWQAAILLFVSCANYAHKRLVSAKQEQEASKAAEVPEAVKSMIDDLQAKLNSLLLRK